MTNELLKATKNDTYRIEKNYILFTRQSIKNHKYFIKSQQPKLSHDQC